MGRTLFMGIDIGTSETKGVILDESFDPVVTYAVPHGIDNPAPNQYEHDAEAVWMPARAKRLTICTIFMARKE